MKKLVNEREENNNFTDIIDFMSRSDHEIINKRQLEKLIQSGSFDSIYKNRAFLFNNVINFVNIFGKSKNESNEQSNLFEYDKINIKDKKIFNQNIEEWNSSLKLFYELEVIGFYFSNHPINNYPNYFFEKIGVINHENILKNKKIKNAKLIGSILDIKDRSNKEGRKYAFITVSNLTSQFEMSVFNDTILKYKDLIKEGNTLLFHVDISWENENLRIIIKKIEDLNKIYSNSKIKINLYLSESQDFSLLEKFLTKSSDKNSLFVFYEKNGRLVSFDFSKNYKISNFSKLDELNLSKKINYSLEIQ